MGHRRGQAESGGRRGWFSFAPACRFYTCWDCCAPISVAARAACFIFWAISFRTLGVQPSGLSPAARSPGPHLPGADRDVLAPGQRLLWHHVVINMPCIYVLAIGLFRS